MFPRFSKIRFFYIIIPIMCLVLLGCGTHYSSTVVSSGKAGPYWYSYEAHHSRNIFKAMTWFDLYLYKKRLWSYKKIEYFKYEVDSSTCTIKVFPSPYKKPNKRFAINWCDHTTKKLKGYARRDTLLRQTLKGTWEISHTQQIPGDSVRNNAFFDNRTHFRFAFGTGPVNDSTWSLASKQYVVKDSVIIIEPRRRFKIKKLTSNELVLQEYILNKGSRTQYTPGNLVGYFRRKNTLNK